MKSLHIEIASENALIVYATGDSLQAKNDFVRRLYQYLVARQDPCWLSLVPAYDSLLVVFDSESLDHYQAKHLIGDCLPKIEPLSKHIMGQSNSLLTLPVYYDPPIENDLQRISEHHGLSKEEIIELHLGGEYQVYCLGFAPGFAFLAEVDERIAMPRLSTPRKRVPAGAVAIADRQTAIYPSASPGGWNIIGLCPTPLFNAKQKPATPFEVGMTVKFYAINQQQYLNMGGVL